MKKYLRLFVFAASFVVGLTFNGCILDAFDTLFQNVPISANVSINDNKTSSVSSTTINLDSSSVYRSYKNKIKYITFAQATFVASEVTPASLQVDLQFTLSTATGQLIFAKLFTGVKPSSYIGDANKFTLELTESEKSFLNTLLNSSNKIYIGRVSVNNISGFTGSYTLKGHYDVALTLEVNTK
jgi:hypothetical protein